MTNTQPTAIYRVTKDGTILNDSWAGRLISLTFTDNRGPTADQLDITLDDSDGALAMPSRGATLSLAIGWQHTGLMNKGTFVVDDVEHTGPPDRLTIRARSADLRTGLTTQKERSWHQTTVGSIVASIAASNNLTANISEALKAEAIEHIDQTNESDANLLVRLSKMFDAVFTVKNNRLLFLNKGLGENAAGEALPGIHITREDEDQHRFHSADRETAQGVKALYHDLDKAIKGEVIVNASNAEKTSYTPPAKLSASADNIIVMRHTYANKANAYRAARSKLKALQRGTSTLNLTLALGEPSITPEQTATVNGFKPEINSTSWLVKKATHTLDADGGMGSSVEMELKIE